MATIPLPPDFREFLKLLNRNKVKYLLIGGYAVGFHGYVQATGNMDIWISRSPQNAEQLVNVLREFGFNVPKLAPDMFMKKNK